MSLQKEEARQMRRKKIFVALREKGNNEAGVVIILVAVVMIVLIAIAALAVDVGYLLVGRNELQNAADASALAATRQLGAIYEPMSYSDQQSYTCDPYADGVIPMAKAVSNSAAGQNVTVLDSDVVIGTWDASSKVLTPTLNQPDAVRVTTRRDGNVVSGPIGTFFARIFNVQSAPVTATATAALTGESTVAEGGLPIPIGIPRRWFENPDFCGSPINFYPPCNHEPCDTAEGCAGYHTYTHEPASSSYLMKTIMPGIWQGSFDSPEATAYGTSFEFTGGTLSNLMNPPDYPFITLFDAMKVRGPNDEDADSDPNTWTTKVVVCDSDTCANPNQDQLVIGFATVRITNVVGAPNPTIQGEVLCDFVDPGRGSGGEYGTKGSIPGLVQ
jgi:Flp pilus assembly protein TadG